MTKPSHTMTQAPSLPGPHAGYMPGFGNDFETEALPDALPQGMNSPQKCNYGLYGEQLSAQHLPRRRVRMNGRGAIASARQ
jgi:homogentisate 1,2-dioxygenase